MKQTYSATELAAMLGLSPRRLRELVVEGWIPRQANGRYPCRAITTYCKQLREVAADRVSHDADSPDLVKERALLARAQRRQIEQKMAVDAGELVNARDVTLTFTAMVTRARTRLLGLGSAAKGRIPTLTVRDIDAIEQLVTQTLEALADDENGEDDGARCRA